MNVDQTAAQIQSQDASLLRSIILRMVRPDYGNMINRHRTCTVDGDEENIAPGDLSLQLQAAMRGRLLQPMNAL